LLSQALVVWLLSQALVLWLSGDVLFNFLEDKISFFILLRGETAKVSAANCNVAAAAGVAWIAVAMKRRKAASSPA
jgi:hypothetical protein